MATKTIVLITGANTGIGLEVVRALLQSANPYHIIVGSRSVEKGDAAVARLRKDFPSTPSTLETLQIDITSDDSINAAFTSVSSAHSHIDVLVNNAGVQFDGDFKGGSTSIREVFNKNYDVNVSGTQVLTSTFAPILIKSPSPRLLFLSSGTSTLEGCSNSLMPLGRVEIPTGWPKPVNPLTGYRASKTALNMVMLNWHWILQVDGVKTWAISPGFLATGLGGSSEMWKQAGAGDASIGGEFIAKVIEGERDADVGKVINKSGVQPW